MLLKMVLVDDIKVDYGIIGMISFDADSVLLGCFGEDVEVVGVGVQIAAVEDLVGRGVDC